MYKKLFIVVLFGLGLIACTTKETPSGIQVKFITSGSGEHVEGGDYLLIDMVYKDGNDSIWSNTDKNTGPLIVQMADSLPENDLVLEVLSMLSKGDSVHFDIPAYDLFTNTFRRPLPPVVDSASAFTFNIGLVDIFNLEQAQAYDNKRREEMQAKFLEEQAQQLGKDTLQIDAYLADNNLKAQTTESGLRYIVSREGKGENVQDGQTVSVNYAGFLLDGTYFDSNIESVVKANGSAEPGRTYEPLLVTVGQRQVIEGWEEAMKLMNKGSKIKVYIPSTLAYGPRQRSEVILPHSILTFEMEIMDIQ